MILESEFANPPIPLNISQNLDDFQAFSDRYEDEANRLISFHYLQEMERVGREGDLVILEEDFKMMGHKKIQHIKFDVAKKMVKD